MLLLASAELIVHHFVAGKKPFPNDDMAGRACTDSTAGLVDDYSSSTRDIEQASRQPSTIKWDPIRNNFEGIQRTVDQKRNVESPGREILHP